MRVLTMNVWGVRGDWPGRRAALRAELRELDPDVLSLQETIATDDYDQVKDLLGGSHYVVHQQAREPDGQGVSVASRWPVTGVRELDGQLGPRTAGFAATTLLVDIDAPDGPLLLVNHFPSWRPALEAERCAQTLAAARAIEEMRPDPDAPVVLAGDLDADPDADSVRFWTGRELPTPRTTR
jgi:endonuclease/exonuclease/phosphatase family metal-dependent hydrolase